MSKAEEYIRKNTNQFSNEDGFDYIPWLTPDQARKAVEIGREEMLEKVVEFLSKEENIPLWDDRGGNFGCDNLLLIKNLKQSMKEE